MKKILKLFGVLLAAATLFSLSACDLATLMGGGNTGMKAANGGNNNSSQTGDESGDPINHTFYLSDDQFAHKYFTDTQSFSFTDKDGVHYTECIYQISFSPSTTQETSGTWIMYIRPKASTSNKETQYKGTYEGNVKQEGNVKLYVDGQLLKTIKIEYKEVQLTSTTKTTYVFTTDVSKAHQYYGAQDEK